MDMAPFSSIHVAEIPVASTEKLPMMLNVLVCRLERAEVRQRIAKDWETFALGALAARHPRQI
jgi:hypothetical protein